LRISEREDVNEEVKKSEAKNAGKESKLKGASLEGRVHMKIWRKFWLEKDMAGYSKQKGETRKISEGKRREKRAKTFS